jgi:PhzF family phenazine biosynthesis protein
LPPTAPGASYRVRIFTPRQELPFAGHPSVGSAYAALEAGIAQPDAQGRLVQECAAGLLPMRVDGDGAARRVFVRAPRARRVDDPSSSSDWSGVLDDLSRGSLPIALFDNGPRWWLVEAADEAAVRGLSPNLEAIARLLGRDRRGRPRAVRAGRGGGCAARRALFLPGGRHSGDPVTGSANACIAAWLLENHALPSHRYVASQGREVGRDGHIEVEVDADGEVWIGGQVQVVVEGRLAWRS